MSNFVDGLTNMDTKPAVRLCDKCDKPGLWNLRARTQFLCEEHRKKLEWVQGDPK